MSGKYYPNNYDAIRDAPDEYFEPCSYEEFNEWKLCNWEIPTSVSCLIRAEHIHTGKIKEHVYQRPQSAQKKLMQYMETGEYDVTVCNQESIHLLKINHESDDD